MDFIFTFAVVSLVVLIASLIVFVHNTNSIIRVQEKQIARLRTENFRLKAALRGRRVVKRVEYHDAEGKPQAQIIEIHDGRVDPENIPEFNNI